MLKIKVEDLDLINYYEKVNTIGYEDDCGIDLICPNDIIVPINKVTKINLGISCEFDKGAFWLVSRSSIVNTPLQLANGIGIIDPSYRGPIIAAVRCFKDMQHESTINDKYYVIKKGTRLFQIVSPDGKPIKVQLVDTLTETVRDKKGFGSTN